MQVFSRKGIKKICDAVNGKARARQLREKTLQILSLIWCQKSLTPSFHPSR
jgi:hypothetical protein